MNRAVDEAHADLAIGKVALGRLSLREALAGFQRAQTRLEREFSPVGHDLYARACLLEWQVLHIEGRRGESHAVVRRALPRAAESSSATLLPTLAIKLLETWQTANKFTAASVAVPLHARYSQVARSFEETTWGSHLALNCYFQLIALGLDCRSPELLSEAAREAGRTLRFGAGDSGHFANLRFWESREAMLRGDLDKADELLDDVISTRSSSPYIELADQFPLVNLLLVRGETDEADRVLQEALAEARRVGCHQWARDAEVDRLTLGRIADVN